MSKKWIEQEHINELTMKVIMNMFSNDILDSVLYDHVSTVCGNNDLTTTVYNNVHKVIRQMKLPRPVTWYCPVCQKSKEDYGTICDNCIAVDKVIESL